MSLIFESSFQASAELNPSLRSFISSSIGMFQVFGLESMVSDTKDRTGPPFPTSELHRILSRDSSHKADGKYQYKKKYRQNDLGNDCAQGGAQTEPEFCERFENERVGHGHEQKDNGQQKKDWQFPCLITEKTNEHKGQTGILTLFRTE